MMTSAGYDPTSCVLEIEFVKGAVYQYADVPFDVFQQMLGAPSQGQFFHTRIRGAFACHRVAEVSAQ
jgi:hypothetical protein